MTNEEEKILEEDNDITLEEAAEEAEELQEEESAEEVRDICEEIRELRQEVEQLRGGLRGVGHPEMIQTHLDNFLAAIAGETPVDTNVRNSTEYWLNEIAEHMPEPGTEVIANPTTTGTEEDLTALQVGDDKYLIPAGTEVIANPTMVGTEEDLTGLQVGDTKYKVGGGGGKLYRHTIRFGQSGLGGAGFCCTTLYSKSSTAFTDSTLKTLIGSGRIMAAGFVARDVNGVFNFYSTRLIEVVSNSLKAVGVEGYLTYADNKISVTQHDMSSNITIFDDNVSEVN